MKWSFPIIGCAVCGAVDNQLVIKDEERYYVKCGCGTRGSSRHTIRAAVETWCIQQGVALRKSIEHGHTNTVTTIHHFETVFDFRNGQWRI